MIFTIQDENNYEEDNFENLDNNILPLEEREEEESISKATIINISRVIDTNQDDIIKLVDRNEKIKKLEIQNTSLIPLVREENNRKQNNDSNFRKKRFRKVFKVKKRKKNSKYKDYLEEKRNNKTLEILKKEFKLKKLKKDL